MKKPSHLNQKGEAHMVDISQKEETKRLADTITLYCFFDENDWDQVEQAEYDMDKREELLAIYREQFLGEFQMGGATRIGKGAGACRVDEKVAK